MTRALGPPPFSYSSRAPTSFTITITITDCFLLALSHCSLESLPVIKVFSRCLSERKDLCV